MPYTGRRAVGHNSPVGPLDLASPLRPKGGRDWARLGEESMSRWLWGMVGVMCMAAWGCQEPTLIVPVAPPGYGDNRTPPPEDTPAQALGEEAKREEELARKRAILAALP